MHRSLRFCLMAALALSACDNTEPEADAGLDAGADAGAETPDAAPPTPDAAPPPSDAGPSCTEGCEFVELALGADHSCARRANGEVWCWGSNYYGQLGDNRMRHEDCRAGGVGERIDCSPVPVQVRVGPAAFLQDATQIASDGGYGTCALRESGEVWCWGFEPIERERGGERQKRFVAERIEDFGGVTQVTGWEPTCVLQESGDVVCYGINGAGELGVGDQVENRRLDAARPVMGLADAIEVAAWGHFGGVVCARTAEAVYCWGSDRDGQVGDGEAATDTCMTGGTMGGDFPCSKTASQVLGDGDLPLEDVAQLTVGSAHVCALRSGDEAGSVDCWGDNRAGQLGQPADVDYHIRATEVTGLAGVAQVDAGSRFTCARMIDGTAQCWGFNHNGQLGDGVDDHDTASTDPVCNVPPSVVGDCSHAPVVVSGIDDAVELATGSSHACVIRESGEIWCWGYNTTSQLGDGTRTTRYAPVRVLGLP